MAKTLLLLGGRSDIGVACVHEFAANGFDIILAARGPDELEIAVKDIQIRHGVKAYKAEFDASDTAAHAEFYRSLPAKPDVVLYSIGSLGDQKVSEKDWSEAEKVISSNYTGAVSILSITANDLESRNEGTIIGISSVAGERGRQSSGVGAGASPHRPDDDDWVRWWCHRKASPATPLSRLLQHCHWQSTNTARDRRLCVPALRRVCLCRG